MTGFPLVDAAMRELWQTGCFTLPGSVVFGMWWLRVQHVYVDVSSCLAVGIHGCTRRVVLFAVALLFGTSFKDLKHHVQ